MLLMPVAASAATVEELQAQIKALMTQLQSLKEQMHAQMASSTPDRVNDGDRADRPCLALGRTLARGMRGDDIRDLQEHLMQHGDLASSTATGFFGEATERAVHKMQMRFGIASSTGVVGPFTREHIKQDCGRHLGELKNASSTRMDGRPPMPIGSSSPMMRPEGRGPGGFMSGGDHEGPGHN
jgi:peptidoglycan hydrolase-like protein with peptidoglycan-binding domain